MTQAFEVPQMSERNYDPEHHRILTEEGVKAWNKWRKERSDVAPALEGADLSGADLHRADLNGADLSGARLVRANLNWAELGDADLRSADLREARLIEAKLYRATLAYANLGEATLNDANLLRATLFRGNLSGADLRDANLRGANLIGASLGRANLSGADLAEANLSHSDLTNANLTGADLRSATLVEADLSEASLEGCWVYGISAWRLILPRSEKQGNLRITSDHEPEVTVDNLEVAQFVYLLLHNEKIRGVIDTIGEKGVLILGRFTAERKRVLDAIRGQLRELGYVPMVFDFDKPTQRDFTETVKTLAGMSRFIIADITNPKSSPLELQATVPDYMVPFVPIQNEDEQPFSMFADLQGKYDWVLDVLKYDTVENLIRALEPAVVRPALEKADQLLLRKAEAIRERHVREYS
jgi:hypothetical protein